MPDCAFLCGSIGAEVHGRAEGQIRVNIVALKLGNKAGVATRVGEVSLWERRAGGGRVIGICKEVEEVFETTGLNNANKLDEGVKELECMGCVVWHSTVIAWREDATGRDIVLAGPKSITTLKAVKVFVMACMGLLIVNQLFILQQMNQQSTHVR